MIRQLWRHRPGRIHNTLVGILRTPRDWRGLFPRCGRCCGPGLYGSVSLRLLWWGWLLLNRSPWRGGPGLRGARLSGWGRPGWSRPRLLLCGRRRAGPGGHPRSRSVFPAEGKCDGTKKGDPVRSGVPHAVLLRFALGSRCRWTKTKNDERPREGEPCCTNWEIENLLNLARKRRQGPNRRSMLHRVPRSNTRSSKRKGLKHPSMLGPRSRLRYDLGHNCL